MTPRPTPFATPRPTPYVPPRAAPRAAAAPSGPPRSVEVATANGLPGTFTAPAKPGPFPALLLVSGSRATDRDATIGSNKPLRSFADGLASRGVASLRYDGRPGADWRTQVEDALAALETLRSQQGVDLQWILVGGHERGGALAPEIARRDGKVAGLLFLAPERSLSPQLAATEMARLGANNRRLLAQLESGFHSPETFLESLPPNQAADLRQLHFARTALSLPVPMLFLRGSRDRVVSWEDIATWQDVLGPEDRVAFYSYGRLDHSLAENNPGPMAQQVVDDALAWISDATGYDTSATGGVSIEGGFGDDDLSGIGVIDFGDGSAAASSGGDDGALTFDLGGGGDDDLSGIGVIDFGDGSAPSFDDDDLSGIGVIDFGDGSGSSSSGGGSDVLNFDEAPEDDDLEDIGVFEFE